MSEKNVSISDNTHESNSICVKALKKEINFDTLTEEDARKIYEMKQDEKLLEKYTFPEKPSSDGYYHIYITDNTKANGRRQIKNKTISGLKQMLLLHEKGINGNARKTFGETFLIVQAEKLKYIKSLEKHLSVQNTIGRNKSEYKRFFGGSQIEKKYIDDISKPDIENIILVNLKRYDMHKKSMDSMRAILKAIFTLAYNEHWIDDNPYSRIDFKKYADMLVESTSIEVRVHSDVELERMMDYIHEWQKKKPFYIPAYALEMQIITAMRRGELPPLQWSDVEENHIYIHRELITVKKYDNIPEHFEIVDHTKTNQNRKFPITDELSDFLKRLQLIHERYYKKSPFLFPADTENKCITNNHVYQFYRRMCKKLGIRICREVIKGTHAFRRTKITEVVNKTGGNIIMASELFGNSPEVAGKYYYTGIDLEQAKKVLNQ